MAIAFRNVSVNEGWSTSITVAKPSGTTAGDLLVAVVGIQDPSRTITPPSGWTLLARQDTGPDSYDNYGAVYYKIAGGSEPSDYTWSWTGSSNNVKGGISAYEGVDNSMPIHNWASAQDTSFDTTEPAPSVSVSISNCWGVATLIWEGSANLSSQPSSYTRRSPSLNDDAQIADSNGTISTGTHAPGTWTLSLGKRKSLFTIILKPSAGVTLPIYDLHYRQQRR